MLLAGLIIPPAVVPTIFLLQWLHVYKTLFGLIMVEVAFTVPFATLILRAFVGSIPREIDEAAIIDGASPLRLFFSVIFPLLRPARDRDPRHIRGYLQRLCQSALLPAWRTKRYGPVGAITYYAPWGNIAIFIRDFEYSSGLIPLGKIDGDIEALNVPGPVSVTIELIE